MAESPVKVYGEVCVVYVPPSILTWKGPPPLKVTVIVPFDPPLHVTFVDPVIVAEGGATTVTVTVLDVVEQLVLVFVATTV